MTLKDISKKNILTLKEVIGHNLQVIACSSGPIQIKWSKHKHFHMHPAGQGPTKNSH